MSPEEKDMKQKISLVWFKRDLRTVDHAPLMAAQKLGLPVLPLYVCEPEYWQLPSSSRRHWCFIHDCLQDLRSNLEALGQSLIVRTGDVCDVFADIKQTFEIETIFSHEETGNDWTFQRDKKVISWCLKNGVDLKEFPSNGVVRRLKNRDDWTKIRNKRMADPVILEPDQIKSVSGVERGEIPLQNSKIFGGVLSGCVQKGGRKAGVDILNSFLYERGQHYIYRLSAPGPSEKHCSRLSAHIAYGTLSVREILKALQKRKNELKDTEAKTWKRNLSAFGSRLAWHCHFIQKLEDQPALEYECMHSAFEGMREPDHNEVFFKAWCEGKTGYPFIDACMRNLNYEGWLTFRMRAMLVSFASYHLWLDWRQTGKHLARVFTDYEPGIHYSQLQMQSGVTGINTLRIYSPVKQSQEHDPDGVFIRHWVPELKHVSNQWIHEPWKMDEKVQKNSCCVIGEDYPKPLVDHTEAVKKARSLIGEVRRQPNFRDVSKKVYEKLGSRKSNRRRKKKTVEEDKQLKLDLL